jgi:hypothetical protein
MVTPVEGIGSHWLEESKSVWHDVWVFDVAEVICPDIGLDCNRR